jgi:outer membrane protein assembly factor BamB
MQLGPATIDNGVVYAQTGLGSLAALNAFTGEVVWLSGYPKMRSDSLDLGSSATDKFLPRMLKILARGPSSPIVSEETVVLAPKDSPGLIAFDRRNGAIRWVNELIDARFLIGQSGENVLVADDTVCALSLKTGEVAWQQKLVTPGKSRGLYGRPGFTSNTLYLPTPDGIRLVDARNGKNIDSVQWDPKAGAAANLVTDGRYFAGVNTKFGIIFSVKP